MHHSNVAGGGTLALLFEMVTTVGTFSAGTATVLFEGRFDTTAYDLSPDGMRS